MERSLDDLDGMIDVDVDDAYDMMIRDGMRQTDRQTHTCMQTQGHSDLVFEQKGVIRTGLQGLLMTNLRWT